MHEKIPFVSLINQYDEISKECKRTGEPIYLTKNGEDDLVVMSVDTFEKQQAIIKLEERLLSIELEQRNDTKSYSLEELDDVLKNIVKE